MLEKVFSQIEFEIKQIDHLFEIYANLLQQAQQNSSPDLVEVIAVASVLHSFYNGLENIFLTIAKRIDHNVPDSAQWHRDLLTRMAEATLTRKAVLTAETTRQLAKYLGFRHFYRHSYSFFLEWDELEGLALPLLSIWEQTKNELQLFLDDLKERHTE